MITNENSDSKEFWKDKTYNKRIIKILIKYNVYWISYKKFS